jgi:nucleoside-diphosphate-sugar epimerase
MHLDKGDLAAVTGGTGFIGSRLVSRLASDGFRVRVLSRRATGTHPSHRDVEVVEGDLADESALERLVDGASVVFHLAGLAGVWARDVNAFRTTNVQGTARVLAASGNAGVQRFLHTSTNLVEVDHTVAGGPRILTAYQQSKFEAESLVRARTPEGVDAIIVRPCRVFGPGPLTEANAVTRIIDHYRRGLFRFRLRDGDARGNYVLVDDVVDGMIRAARHGSPERAYTLGGENASIREFLATVDEVTGSRRVVAQLPLGIAKGVARVMETAALFGRKPMITRDWVELFATDWPSSSDLAAQDLGYTPRSLKHGIRRTVEWLTSGSRTW